MWFIKINGWFFQKFLHINFRKYKKKKNDKNYVYVTHHHGWENFFLDARLFRRTILLASPDRALKKGLPKPVYVR